MQADPSSISGFDNSSMLHDEDSDGDVSEVDEFDQLETESEEEEHVAAEGEEEEEDVYRVPGNSLLPADVVEQIIDAEGVTGALAMSKEALFSLSVATEEFIKKIVSTAELQTRTESRSMVSYKDIASVTEQYQEFFFIRDTIPPPLTIQEALVRREEKQRQLEESDPALLTSPPPVTPPTSVAPAKRDSSTAQPKTTKAKIRASKASGPSTKDQRAAAARANTSNQTVETMNGMKGVVVGEAGAETPWTRWLPPNGLSHEDGDPDPSLSTANLISDAELNAHTDESGPMYSIISENAWAVTTDGPGDSTSSVINFGPMPTSAGRTIYTQQRPT
jgi:histone H3/H4